jgi:hypothetical protein
LVGGDATVGDFAGGIYLSQGGETVERSFKKAGALGETKDFVGD